MNRGEELKAQPDADDTRAIHKAIEMEKRSVEHYAAKAQAADQRQQAIYARLADEEREQLDILESILACLNDTGHWFLWDEQAILEGG